jgi:hypothetical protein
VTRGECCATVEPEAGAARTSAPMQARNPTLMNSETRIPRMHLIVALRTQVGQPTPEILPDALGGDSFSRCLEDSSLQGQLTVVIH